MLFLITHSLIPAAFWTTDWPGSFGWRLISSKSVPAIVNQEIGDTPISACRPTIANLLNPVAATKLNYGSDYSDTSSVDIENSESESDLKLEAGRAARMIRSHGGQHWMPLWSLAIRAWRAYSRSPSLLHLHPVLPGQTNMEKNGQGAS